MKNRYSIFDFIITIVKVSYFSKKQKIRTSGSFGLFAQKIST